MATKPSVSSSNPTNNNNNSNNNDGNGNGTSNNGTRSERVRAGVTSFFSWAKGAANQAASAVATAVHQHTNNDSSSSGSTMVHDPSELGITYITQRLIVMGFPESTSSHIGRPIDNASRFLAHHHAHHYMVWNLSEKTYDYQRFEHQVIEFKFAGYPAPPLDMIFTICNSIHGWLNADPKNVAVVHCQTGNGRTSTAIAAYLAWAGLMKSPSAALTHISMLRNVPLSQLIIPTQQRYLGYVTNMLDKKLPSTSPIRLERVIMNGIPRFEAPSLLSGNQDASLVRRCRPYLQIFKAAKLLYTSTGRNADSTLRWYSESDNSILFPVDLILEGDILIRVRHLTSDGKRLSMLRFGFNTGFISAGNARFLRSEIDGACADRRFDRDFFIDMIFRQALHDDSTEMKGSVDTAFWQRAIHRSSKAASPRRIVADGLAVGPSAAFAFSIAGDDEGGDEVEGKASAARVSIPQRLLAKPTHHGSSSSPAVAISAASSASSSSSSSSSSSGDVAAVVTTVTRRTPTLPTTSSSSLSSVPNKTPVVSSMDDNHGNDEFEELEMYLQGLGSLKPGDIDDNDEPDIDDIDLSTEINRLGNDAHGSSPSSTSTSSTTRSSATSVAASSIATRSSGASSIAITTPAPAPTLHAGLITPTLPTSSQRSSSSPLNMSNISGMSSPLNTSDITNPSHSHSQSHDDDLADLLESELNALQVDEDARSLASPSRPSLATPAAAAITGSVGMSANANGTTTSTTITNNTPTRVASSSSSSSIAGTAMGASISAPSPSPTTLTLTPMSSSHHMAQSVESIDDDDTLGVDEQEMALMAALQQELADTKLDDNDNDHDDDHTTTTAHIAATDDLP